MVDKIDTPSDFYTYVVKADIIELRNKPDDLRLVYHACISILSLRDWVFHTYKNRPWTWNGKAQPPFSSKTKIQEHLEALHEEFRIIYDVANFSKHLIMDDNRKRTQAQGIANVQIQSIRTHVGGATLGTFMLNTTMLNEAPHPVTRNSVVIDDGGKLYDVEMSIELTNRVWLQLLAENNW